MRRPFHAMHYSARTRLREYAEAVCWSYSRTRLCYDVFWTHRTRNTSLSLVSARAENKNLRCVSPLSHPDQPLSSDLCFQNFVVPLHPTQRHIRHPIQVQIASDLHLELERPRKSPSQFELPAETPSLVIRGGRWTRSCFYG